MAGLHYHDLFDSSLVTVTDVCCRPSDAGCGGEEDCDSPRIAFTRTGVFVKHVGRERVVADLNHVVFFNAREPYRVSHPVAGGDDCTSFRFDPAVIADAIGEFEPGVRDRPTAPFRHTHGPAGPRTALVQQAFRRWLRAAARDDVAAEECALELLRAVVADAYGVRGERAKRARSSTVRAHRDRAGAARLVLAERFRTPLSLAAVARAVHASPYHLTRVFHREVGLPVHRYLTRLRLAASLERIADGAADLTGLALDLGFSSHSHFTAAFRREFGVTPSTFRCTATTARLRELSKNLTV